MFWKKAKGTDFERALNAYYKWCRRQGIVPTKPSEQYSETGDRHVLLKNQFGLIAKIFFVEETAMPKQKALSLPNSYVLKLQ